MVDWGSVGILAQAGTGFFVLLAGLLTLASASPRRHTVSFSSFLILWGGFLLAGNFASLAIEAGNLAQGQELLILHAVLQGLAALPLIVFTLSYPPSRRIDLDSVPTLGIVLAPAIAVAITAIIDPGLFHGGFTLEEGTLVGGWGPGKAGVFLLFRLAIYAALARLTLVYERSDNDLERGQALYVLLAFSLFVGYESMQDLLLFSDPGAAALTGSVLQDAVFSFTALLGVGMMAWVAHRLLQSRAAPRGQERGLAVTCIAGSLTLGLVSGASFTWSMLPEVSGAGVWRLGTVALIVAAVTRFERPGPERLIPIPVTILGWLGVAAAALLTMQVGLASLLGSPVLAFIALWSLLVVGAGFVAWGRPGTFGELLRELRRQRSSVGQARRDLELYEAALLADRGTQTLGDLREQMSISDAEHEVIQRLTDPHSATPIPSIGPPPDTGDLLDDRYRLEAILGEGASSRVFRAEDTLRGETVAVKLLDRSHAGASQELRRFVYESRICLRLSHPNIVEAHELGHVDGQPYLVFELVEGGTLESYIEPGGLGNREASRVVDGVLAGVQILHDEGLVHRDLKPANILLDEDGTAKVGDLGLADTWDTNRTQQLGPEGVRLREGTPAYMSPETLLGHPPSPRCDVYAAGAILVEALTGRHYLGIRDAPYATVRRAVLDAPPQLEGVDPELASICRRALAKDPSRRYGSAREMRKVIRDVVQPELEADYEMVLSEIVHPEDGDQHAAHPDQRAADGAPSEGA